MARVLHLLKAGDPALALATIGHQQRAGDTVTIALLPGAAVIPPPGVTTHRVPDDLTWDGLLEAIFDADRVTAW